MQNQTPSGDTWQTRADRLGIKMPTIAKITGTNLRSVKAYRRGEFNPSPEWVARVEDLLSRIEGAAAQEIVA